MTMMYLLGTLSLLRHPNLRRPYRSPQQSAARRRRPTPQVGRVSRRDHATGRATGHDRCQTTKARQAGARPAMRYAYRAIDNAAAKELTHGDLGRHPRPAQRAHLPAGPDPRRRPRPDRRGRLARPVGEQQAALELHRRHRPGPAAGAVHRLAGRAAHRRAPPPPSRWSSRSPTTSAARSSTSTTSARPRTR